MVVTGDRDLFQLIEPGVRVMATSRGITETKVYDRDAVIDRYGIAPELVPDFTGLKGDTSDNIPGVPGIGEKTASQLLQEYGDLEGVLSNIDSISGAKRKENLTNHAEDARVSKQLATAVRDGGGGRGPRRVTRARARPLAPARGVPGVRAAGSRCGAWRRRWATRRRPRRASARKSEMAVRARRSRPPSCPRPRASCSRWPSAAPRPTEPPEGELLPADDASDSQLRGVRRQRGGAGRGVGVARGRGAGPRRPAAGGARLEDHRLLRALRGPRGARARHHARRLPDRPRSARLPAGGAGRGRGHRRRS